MKAAEQERQFFPFVDIMKDGIVYTSFGFEPFTPNNEFRYKTFQIQNNFQEFGQGTRPELRRFAGRYNSENVFFYAAQSVYVYNSLTDFYPDANDYLANPNRTTSPLSCVDSTSAGTTSPARRNPCSH